MQQNISERRYHHGDLRRAIVDAALDLMREERNSHFTLREIARRVGVSHTAPYKHFPDRGALLAALSAIGFDQLRASLRQARSGTGGESRQALLSIARAYLDFGIDNAALYRLMFRAGGVDPCEADDRAGAGSLFDMVTDILGRGRTSGAFRQRPAREYATAYWSLLHGITMLSIDGLLPPKKFGPDPLAAALGPLMEGIATPD